MGEGGWRLGKLGNLRTTFHNPYLAVPFVQYGAPTRSTTSYLICAFWNDSAIALGTYQFAQDMLAAVWVAFACGQNAGLLENASPGGEAPLLGCGAETVVLGTWDLLVRDRPDPREICATVSPTLDDMLHFYPSHFSIFSSYSPNIVELRQFHHLATDQLLLPISQLDIQIQKRSQCAQQLETAQSWSQLVMGLGYSNSTSVMILDLFSIDPSKFYAVSRIKRHRATNIVCKLLSFVLAGTRRTCGSRVMIFGVRVDRA